MQKPHCWHTQCRLNKVVSHVSHSSLMPFTARFHTGTTVGGGGGRREGGEGGGGKEEEGGGRGW